MMGINFRFGDSVWYHYVFTVLGVGSADYLSSGYLFAAASIWPHMRARRLASYADGYLDHWLLRMTMRMRMPHAYAHLLNARVRGRACVYSCAYLLVASDRAVYRQNGEIIKFYAFIYR